RAHVLRVPRNYREFDKALVSVQPEQRSLENRIVLTKHPKQMWNGVRPDGLHRLFRRPANLDRTAGSQIVGPGAQRSSLPHGLRWSRAPDETDSEAGQK